MKVIKQAIVNEVPPPPTHRAIFEVTEQERVWLRSFFGQLRPQTIQTGVNSYIGNEITLRQATEISMLLYEAFDKKY